MMRNPASGSAGINQTTSSMAQPFSSARSSAVALGLRRRIATMMPRPTTTSAAATTITKNTVVCPLMSPSLRATATKREVDGVEHQLDAHQHDQRVATNQHTDRADAEQHGGQHEVPRRRGDAAIGDHDGVSVDRLRCPTRQQHRADDGDHQQHRGELERQHVIAEQVARPARGCCCRGSADVSTRDLRGRCVPMLSRDEMAANMIRPMTPTADDARRPCAAA